MSWTVLFFRNLQMSLCTVRPVFLKIAHPIFLSVFGLLQIYLSKGKRGREETNFSLREANLSSVSLKCFVKSWGCILLEPVKISVIHINKFYISRFNHFFPQALVCSEAETEISCSGPLQPSPSLKETVIHMKSLK